MTIYAVSSGEYSDWTIEAVFSTREKAEQFKQDYFGGSYDCVDIWEWDIDSRLGDKREFVTHFECLLNLRTGEMLRQTSRVQLRKDYEMSRRDYPESVAEPASHAPDGYAFGHSIKNEQHAQKLASEARQNWLRQNSQRIPQVFLEAQTESRMLYGKNGKID